jgi:phosphoribosylamine--glycine ligase
MNVLLVGSGGREHALAWKIAQSPLLTRLVVSPGNPGMARLGEVRAVPVDDVEGLAALALEMAADLVVVGPEAPLALGLADRLSQLGVPCFGPTASAARLESSKAFTKAFAQRWSLPTADFELVETIDRIDAALDRFTEPYVIKADGLAAGKGVVIAAHRDEARAAAQDMLGGAFGGAGARIVVEAFMAGEEASLFALCDGRTALLFGGAQDHKRAYDGDLGPNTGGMGAYSPAPVLTPDVVSAAERELIAPTVAGMAAEGTPFTGVLFAGLMVAQDGPRLVEFNARFGDPECQTLMLRLESDLLPYLQAAAAGRLNETPPPVWREDAAICVVLAAKGYPDGPELGSIIAGAEADFGEDVVVFQAGVKRDADGRLIAAGGRVLNVCARATTVEAARALAYDAITKIDWPGGFHRTDIAWRALTRSASVRTGS